MNDGTDDGTYAVLQLTSVDAPISPYPTTAPNRTFTAPKTASDEAPIDDCTRLERLWQSDLESTAPFSEAPLYGDMGEDEPRCGDANDPINGLENEYLRALVWQCLAKGFTNEANQVKQIWVFVTFGENPRYRKATKRLRAMRRKFNL